MLLTWHLHKNSQQNLDGKLLKVCKKKVIYIRKMKGKKVISVVGQNKN